MDIEFTAEQVTESLFEAVREGKTDVAASLTRLLAVYYPEQLQMIQLAAALAGKTP